MEIFQYAISVLGPLSLFLLLVFVFIVNRNYGS